MTDELLEQWMKEPDAHYWLVWNPRALSFWWCKIKPDDIEWLKGGIALQMPIDRRRKKNKEKLKNE